MTKHNTRFRALGAFLTTHPTDADAIFAHVRAARAARLAARRNRPR